MFASISRYRVKPGMEDSLKAHNEEWKTNIRPQTVGFISVHVYRGARNPREWTSVALFVDQYSEMASSNLTDHKLWYRTMLEMLEEPPTYWQGEMVQEG